MNPNTIVPSQPYTLSYYITDHLDSTTYYAQAKVYDATTGELLETHNLTRQTTNTHLYSKRVNAPGDTSGRGRKIIVVATLYTDSGYTTKADGYQEQAENYLVFNPQFSTSGGGYVDYDWIRDQVEKIVALAVEKILGKETKPTDLSPVLEAIKKIDIPKAGNSFVQISRTDLTPVLALIGRVNAELKAKIDKIEFPTPEKVDLDPIVEAVSNAADLNAEYKKDILDALERVFVKGTLALEIEGVKHRKIQELRDLLMDPDIKEALSYVPKDEKKGKMIDIRSLIDKDFKKN